MKQTRIVAAVLLGLTVIVIAGVVQPIDGGENMLAVSSGGTIDEELGQIKSPDGRSITILSHRYKHAPGRPPEPPKTLERWGRLKILRDGKTIYDSGHENLNIYQMSAGFALDAMWSPDSRHLDARLSYLWLCAEFLYNYRLEL